MKRAERAARVGRFGTVALFVAAAGIIGVAVTRTRSTDGAVLAQSFAGRPVRWARAEIQIELVESSTLPTGVLRDAMLMGARAWNDALSDCGAPRLLIASGWSTRTKLARDGISTIFVRAKRWCPEGRAEPNDCYEAHRTAITHLYPSDPPERLYGELHEADIEINNVGFRWSLDGRDDETRSLRALAVHELGHVLGLDHPCATAPARGTARRVCAPRDKDSVMYPAPVEVGRAPVLAPTEAEIEVLCRLYRDFPLSEREREGKQ